MRRLNKDIEREAFAKAHQSGRVGKDRDEMADRLQKQGKAANRSDAARPGNGARANS